MIGRRPVRRSLWRDRAGSTLIEFAVGFPMVMMIGGYGVEIANIAITRMQLNQITLALADNASRIGVDNGQAQYQLREGDLSDVLQGARLMGQGLKLTTRGRVTVTSLENVQQSYSDHDSDTAPVQRLHWQRCIGQRGGPNDPGYDSSYAATPLLTAGTDSTYANRGPNSTGLGTSPVVVAPSGMGVIYVEVAYQYQPLFGSMFSSKPIMRSTASLIVRDKRIFTQIFNPQSALGAKTTPATCNLYGA